MAVRRAGRVQSPLDTILQQLQTSQQQIQAAQLTREQEIRKIIDENISRYMPGGAFQQAALGQLATQKVSDVGAGMQRLIASGMAGTEAAGGLETGWEQAVGAPARLKLEDLMTERLSQAQLAKAGFLERIEQPYPDYAMVAQLAGQAAAGPSYAVSPTAAPGYAKPYKSLEDWLSTEFMAGYGSPAAPSPASAPGAPAAPQGGRYPTTAPSPQMIMPSTIYGAAYKGGAPTAETALPSTIYGTPTRGISQTGMPGLPGTSSAPTTGDFYKKVRAAKSWEEYLGLAQGAGLKPGSRREWEVARRYY